MFKVMFCRFPYGASEHPHVTNWMIETIVKAKKDPRISEVLHREYDDTPITMTRNLALEEAKREKADYVVFIDSDMSPDRYGGKPFWDSSWEFLMTDRDKGPCTIGAPYCGPPPQENIYVFLFRNYNTDDPVISWSVEQFTREEAATRMGIERVAALPTGLMIIDIRALEKLPYPYFDYEWTDATQSHKASTEDVFFTRNLTLLGVPQFCNWDAWAGHVKRKIVAKPWVMTVDDVRKEFAESIRRNLMANERHINVGHTKLMVAKGEIEKNKLITADQVDLKATDQKHLDQAIKDSDRQPIQIIEPGVARLPDDWLWENVPASLEMFSRKWTDDLHSHESTAKNFDKALAFFPELQNYREWMEERSWGFSGRESVYFWKLLVDAMPSEFSFLEIGVHRGATVCLVGMLAQTQKKSAHVVALSKFDGTEVERFDPNQGQHLPDLLYAWKQFVTIPPGGVVLSPIIGDSTDQDSVNKANTNGPYDAVYIDGGHEFLVASLDISNYSPMVKPGGFLVIDDCANDLKLPRGQFPGFKTVTDAALNHLPRTESDQWKHLGNVGHIRLWRRKPIEPLSDLERCQVMNMTGPWGAGTYARSGGASLAPKEDDGEAVAG